jgi:nitroimidazol reductase NimA-like FMN-containing flavoprotein (pyridoxamine 5'-phosphate oxidase superfamily)
VVERFLQLRARWFSISMRYHVRRRDKEIVDKEAMKKILRSTDYVTVAMCMDGEPYLVSLSHVYDEEEGCIYFHCAGEGKKLDFLRANPRVWGQALINHGYHEGECSHLYASVMFDGVVDFVEGVDEKRRVLTQMIRFQDSNPEPLLGRLVNLESQRDDLARTIVGRIRIGEMTGKKSAEVDL